MNFIKTSDPSTIQYLRSHGFQEVKTEGNTDIVTFFNDSSKTVAFADAKLVYSNKLDI